jgi:predicted SAM-dependent methyltransferase
VAVPDGLHPNPNLIEAVRVDGSGSAAQEHKVLYTYRTLKEVFEAVGFKVELYEYFDEQGRFHYREWDPQEGTIRRSKRFDRRNKDGVLRYTSIVLDAKKK